MARIAGKDVPNEKPLVVSLTYIYGIGMSRAYKICADAQIDPNKRGKDMSEPELTKIREQVNKYRVEGDLHLEEIGSYRGLRHRKHLPSRGQRTKTNARTCKGKKKTVANKKKATA